MIYFQFFHGNISASESVEILSFMSSQLDSNLEHPKDIEMFANLTVSLLKNNPLSDSSMDVSEKKDYIGVRN